jgi:hypothetical protein
MWGNWDGGVDGMIGSRSATVPRVRNCPACQTVTLFGMGYDGGIAQRNRYEARSMGRRCPA